MKQDKNEIAKAVINSMNEDNGNVASALFYIGDSLQEVAKAIQALGIGNASTDMGAVEFLSVSIREGLERIASGISEK